MITENLQKLNADLLSSYAAVDAKNGTIPTDKNSNNLAASIATIPTGGGGGVGEHWEPHPEWWDIEQIVNEDTGEPGSGKVAYLLLGTSASTPIPVSATETKDMPFYKVKTSDGAVYTSTPDGGHLWDRSKDKVSKDGLLRTRWLVCYTTNNNPATYRDYGLWARTNLNMVLKYCVFKDALFASNTFGGTPAGTNACPLLESIKYIGTSRSTSGAIGLFQNCTYLQKLELAPCANTVSGLYLTFSGCPASLFVRFPENTLITSNNTGFSGGISEVRGWKIGRGFSSASAWQKLSTFNYLSIATLKDIADNLEDNTGGVAIDFEIGAANIDKLQNGYQYILSIITNKNYNVL